MAIFSLFLVFFSFQIFAIPSNEVTCPIPSTDQLTRLKKLNLLILDKFPGTLTIINNVHQEFTCSNCDQQDFELSQRIKSEQDLIVFLDRHQNTFCHDCISDQDKSRKVKQPL